MTAWRLTTIFLTRPPSPETWKGSNNLNRWYWVAKEDRCRWNGRNGKQEQKQLSPVVIEIILIGFTKASSHPSVLFVFAVNVVLRFDLRRYVGGIEFVEMLPTERHQYRVNDTSIRRTQ